MSPLAITILSFATVSLLVAATASTVYDVFFRYRTEVKKRIDAQLGPQAADGPDEIRLFHDMTPGETGPADWLRRCRRRWADALQHSGLPFTPQTFGLVLLAATSVGFAAASYAGGNAWAGTVGGGIGLVLPLAYIWSRRRAHVEKLRAQLPKAFDVMSRAVQAGQTMPAAIQIVADDFEPPISQEFAYCCEQQNLGIQPHVALRTLARRTGVMELQIFVVALLVQSRSGGNLAELLDNLASIIRQRARLEGRMKALTSEGRMQAVVLMLLPLLALIGLLVLAPDYVQTLFDRPWLLAIAFGAQLVGAVWIRMIMNFDY